jgi:hypothetical protein
MVACIDLYQDILENEMASQPTLSRLKQTES